MKKLNLNNLQITSFVTKEQKQSSKGGRTNGRACYFDSDPYCEDTITVYFGTCLYPC